MKDLSSGIRREKIIYILKQNKIVKVSYLAERFGVDRKTIQRDLNLLSSSYPIRVTNGRHGGVQIMKSSITENEYVDTTVMAISIIQKVIDRTELEGKCCLKKPEIDVLKQYIDIHKKFF